MRISKISDTDRFQRLARHALIQRRFRRGHGAKGIGMEREAGFELVLLDAHTIEKSYGWVFFHDSQRHVQSGDFGDSVAGNAPILVTKAVGQIHITGTAMPVEHYLKKFEAGGDKNGTEC